MKEISISEFETLAKSEQASVFAFGAPWCKDCIKAKPWLLELSEDFAQIGFYHIDVDVNETARSSCNIRHIPTILFCKNGVILDERIVEPNSKEQLKEAIVKNLF